MSRLSAGRIMAQKPMSCSQCFTARSLNEGTRLPRFLPELGECVATERFAAVGEVTRDV